MNSTMAKITLFFLSRYFAHNKDNGGCAYLVSLSQGLAETMGAAATSNERDVQLHLKIANLVVKQVFLHGHL